MEGDRDKDKPMSVQLLFIHMEGDRDKDKPMSVQLIPTNDPKVFHVFKKGRDGGDPEFLGFVKWDRGGLLSESIPNRMRQLSSLVPFFELWLFSTVILFSTAISLLVFFPFASCLISNSSYSFDSILHP